MAVKEIKSYQLSITAGPQTGNLRASIHLSDEKGTIGVLGFVEDGTVPPSMMSGVPVGYFPVARYTDIVDLLRNERPAYLVTNGADVEISTKDEAVGEGEPKVSAFAPFKFPL